MILASFTVHGKAIPQGSKRSMPIFKKGGKPVMVGNRPMTRVINANPKLGEWRQEVALVASKNYEGELYHGPVWLKLYFTRPRPKGHYGTGRNADKLKASAPEHPVSRPDTLKLARAIEDALTGIIWKDDSQICRHEIVKSWGDFYQVIVIAETL